MNKIETLKKELKSTKNTESKKLSLIEQYNELKKEAKDALLFFRLGDFYELFLEDAKIASKELNLILTKRDTGKDGSVTMCGVPSSSIDSYIFKLVSAGFKVAISEQAKESENGLLRREIIRIVTPGTIIDETILDKERNNYLASVCYENKRFAVIWADISTLEINNKSFESLEELNGFLCKICPSEIICNEEMLNKSLDLNAIKGGLLCKFTLFDESAFNYENSLAYLRERHTSLNISEKGSICALGALLKYFSATQKREFTNLEKIENDTHNYLQIDYNAVRSLELFTNIADGKKEGSLISVLNRTSTAMGARMMRKWLSYPLIDAKEINLRLDGVEELVYSYHSTALRDELCEFKDLERLTGKLLYSNMNAKDCLNIGISLSKISFIKNTLKKLKSDIFSLIDDRIGNLDYLSDTILKAINDDSSAISIIKKGFDRELDEILEKRKKAIDILLQLEKNERESTGIKNLKIESNKLIGYYIEVPKSQINNIPYRYKKKQSLSTCERYTMDEIKEMEEIIIECEENILSLEKDIFQKIIANIKKEQKILLDSASAIAKLDCLLSFSLVSKENNYCKPIINDNSKMEIIEGRHAVVEQYQGRFIANDTRLDNSENKIMLITGPNMSGKSVYMRQIALIVILAHIGCFVPAKSATICITDKIFTRIGANDDVSRGRSTFMVEMNEVAYILKSATENSLILLDEVGRGTSTYDGISIAFSILEALANEYGSKVLFSTHYHELTKLDSVLKGIKNYKLTVKEENGTILFMRKLIEGSSSKSFGIEVASMAGINHKIISRAKQVLQRLEKGKNDIF